MKRFLSLVLLVSMLLPACFAANYSVVVTNGKGCDTFSDSSLTDSNGHLASRTVLVVTDEKDFSAHIHYQNRSFWVSFADITPVTDLCESAVINTDCSVYRKPDTSSDQAKVKKGLKVNLVGTKGKWACIEKNGNVGYVALSNITKTPAEAAKEEPFSGRDVADFAACVYKKTKLYASPSSSSRSLLSLSSGKKVTVTHYNSSWARVVCDGKTGYVPTANLYATCSLRAETKNTAPVYAGASASSKRLGTLAKGTQVTLDAFTLTWARITLNGRTGYCRLCLLTRLDSPIDSVDASDGGSDARKDFSDAVVQEEPSGGADPLSVAGSGAQFVYDYLRSVTGLNTAAACAVMANLYRESGYRPGALASSGHYGICQWGGIRKTNLYTVAQQAGLDPESLVGQMYFLEYELKHTYKKVWDVLTSIPNSAQGAYDAGYYFCYYYEVPANRETSSVSRGTLAAETFFPEYS